MDPLLLHKSREGGSGDKPEGGDKPESATGGAPDAAAGGGQAQEDDAMTSATRDYVPHGVPVAAPAEAAQRDDAVAELTALAAATDQALRSLPVMTGCEQRAQCVADWLLGIGFVLLDRPGQITRCTRRLEECAKTAPLRDMHGPCGGLVRCVVSLSFAYTRAVAVARAPGGLLRDSRCANQVVGCVKELPQHFAVPALVDRVANWVPNSVRLDAGMPEGCAAGPAALLQAGLDWCDVKRTLSAGLAPPDGDSASAADHVITELVGALWQALQLVAGGLVLDAERHAAFSLQGVCLPFSRACYLIGWPARLIEFNDLYQLCCESGLDEPPIPELPGGAWDCSGFPCIKADNSGPSLSCIVRLATPTDRPEPTASEAATGPFPEARVRVGDKLHVLPVAEFYRRLVTAEPWFFRAEAPAHVGGSTVSSASGGAGAGPCGATQAMLAPWDAGVPGAEVHLISCDAMGMIKEAFASRAWAASFGFVWAVLPVVTGLACPRCPAPFTPWSASQLFTLAPLPQPQ